MTAFGGNLAPYPPIQNGKEKRGGLMMPADKIKIDAALVTVTTDANSWVVDHLGSGKRVWSQSAQYTGAAIPAATSKVVSFALPVGVATGSLVRASAAVHTSAFAGSIRAGIDMVAASTFLTVEIVATGANLSALTTEINLDIWLWEK